MKRIVIAVITCVEYRLIQNSGLRMWPDVFYCFRSAEWPWIVLVTNGHCNMHITTAGWCEWW